VEIKEYCKKLQNLACSIPEISIPVKDHFGFMLRSFLDKQSDHMDTLFRIHSKNDMQLISRSMIEGLCLIKWAKLDESRSLKWRTFGYVHNFRVLNDPIQGKKVTPEKREETLNGMKEYGELFLKKKTNTADLYHKDWKCGATISTISSEVEGDVLYKQLYGPLSDWQHWGPASMSKMLDTYPDGYGYDHRHGSKLATTSYAVAFQCMFEMLKLLSSHFQGQLPEYPEKLAEIYNDYIEFIDRDLNK
jgi:hypothetical protein